MNLRKLGMFLSLALLLAGVTVFAQQSGGGFTLNGVITGGGGVSTGGTFEVGGSAGQPVTTDKLSGGAFSLTNGYWSIPTLNLVNNGDFADPVAASPTLNWRPFAQPASGIVQRVQNGVFEFYRVFGATQAVVFQETGQPLPASAPVRVTFQLGNTSVNPRRALILLHDSNFQDSLVCSFWLPGSAPLRTYQILSKTRLAWANTSISIYASTQSPAGDQGYYQVDNVVFQYEPSLNINETKCIDPLAPAAGAGADGPNLIDNGDFSLPLQSTPINAWRAFGNINAQLVGGVAQIFRTGTPRGVLFQQDPTVINPGVTLEATMQIGNGDTRPMRVVVIIHKANFADLNVCAFWLAPNTPTPQTYTMRIFSRIAWTDGIALSIYPDTLYTAPAPTVGLRVDNVTLRQRPSKAIVGTECYPPGSTPSDVADFEAMLEAQQPTVDVPATPILPPGELPILATPVPFTGQESENTGEGQLSEEGAPGS